MNLSKRIKKTRIKNGLTQLDLSEKSGLTLRTIQRIENEEVTPSIHSLNRISEVLNEDFSSSENKSIFKKSYVFILLGIFSLTLGFYYVSFKELPPPPFDYWKQVYQELNTSDGGYIKYYDFPARI